MAPRITLFIAFLFLSCTIKAEESARELFKFAKFNLDQGEYQKALNLINQAIKIETDYSSAYVLRAEIFIKLSNYKAAIEDASRIIYTEGATTALISNSYLLRGEAYYELGRYAEAMTDIRIYLQADASSPKAYFLLGLVYLQKDIAFEALENFDNAIKYDNQQAEYFYHRAQLKADFFKPLPGTATYNEIMTDIQTAQSLNSADARPYELKCKMLKLNAEHQKEIYLNELDKAIERFPQKAEFYNQRGMAQVLDYQFLPALSDFNAAIELGGPDESTLRNRALCYHNLGQYNNALKDYNESVDIMIKMYQETDDKQTKSRLAETLVMRGRTLEATGQPDNACEDYYNAAKLGSKNGLNHYRKNCNIYN